MVEMFERDLLDARRITLEEWNERSCGDRTLEWLYGILRSQY